MRTISSSRPSPALIIAILALFVGLGGSSYAAVKLNGAQVRTNSMPGNRVKADTLTGQQINEASLGTVPSAAAASVSKSLNGRSQASFMASTTRIEFSRTAVAAQKPSGVVEANCRNDERAIGGGGAWAFPNASATSVTTSSLMTLNVSAPKLDPSGKRISGWQAAGYNGTPANLNVALELRVYAICVPLEAPVAG